MGWASLLRCGNSCRVATPLEPLLTLVCPLCCQPPLLVLDGGHQAWCGNENGCNVITWDMYIPLDEQLMKPSFVDWTWKDPDD